MDIRNFNISKLNTNIYFSKYFKNILILTTSSIAVVEIFKKEYYLGIPSAITWLLLIINIKKFSSEKNDT